MENQARSFDYKNLLYILIAAASVFPLTFFLNNFGDKTTIRLILISFPFIFAGLLNFRLALFLFFATWLTNLYPWPLFALAHFVIPYLFIAFFITNSKLSYSDFKSVFTFPVILFVLFLLPSFINTPVVFESAFSMLLLAGFLALILLFNMWIKSNREITFIAVTYIGLTLLNSLYLIFQGVTTGKRVFGIAGITFVDILGIAIVITFIVMLTAPKDKRAVYAFLLIILVLASFFTKTRNVWINIGVVLFSSFIHIIVRAGYLKIEKKKLLRVGVVASVLIVLLGSFLISFYGKEFFRLESTRELTKEAIEAGEIQNSFVTRYFIWYTGFNGFMQHPVAGIGIYSFSFASEQYNQLPDLLYKKFVKDLTLHHGYYSILVEAGLIGFTGLIIFLVMIFKRARKILKQAENTEYFLPAFISFWVLIYIIISLFFTDAWFWGRMILMWGVLMGIISGIDKLLKAKLNTAGE